MKISILSNKNKLSKLIITICIALIIIIPLLLIWQGLDFTDIGYSLTCYQQIFNDPSCIAYCLPNWMQYIIGGLWMKIFNSLGLMGINLGGVVITWLTAIFTYKILNKYIEKTILLIGLTVTTIYSLDYIIMIHYDNLTALFFIITIFLLMKYIDKHKTMYLFAAGIAECINTLVRLPNILGFIFLIAVIIYNYHENKNLKKQISDILIFCIGFILALTISFLIMAKTNYLNLFINGIYALFNLSSSKGNIHSGNKLINTFFSSNCNSIGYASLVIFFGSIVCIVLSKIKNRLLFLSSNVLILFFIIYGIYFYTINTIVGMSYIICVIYIFNLEISCIGFRLINLLGLLMLIISPVGTTIGQGITIYTSWLTIPIIFYFLFTVYKNISVIQVDTFNSKGSKRLSISEKAIKSFCILIVFLISFNVVKNTYHFTYRDSSDRLTMTYKLDNKYLRYTYTTKERSQAVNELLNALKKYVHKNDYLWAEGSMSTVYYATEAKPYVSNPWDSSMEIPLQNALEKAKSENYSLPVIIKQNISTGDQNWPQKLCKLTDHYGITENHNAIIDKFIKDYDYKLVWNNTYFKIYVTDKNN